MINPMHYKLFCSLSISIPEIFEFFFVVHPFSSPSLMESEIKRTQSCTYTCINKDPQRKKKNFRKMIIYDNSSNITTSIFSSSPSFLSATTSWAPFWDSVSGASSANATGLDKSG